MFVDRVRRLFGDHNHPLLYHPCLWAMAINSNSITIDSNYYAMYIPMVQHQVMRKSDNLPFLRAALPQVARDSCDQGSVDTAHNLYLWISIGLRPVFIPECRSGSGGARRERGRLRS
jgi:hypothetical protein